MRRKNDNGGEKEHEELKLHRKIKLRIRKGNKNVQKGRHSRRSCLGRRKTHYKKKKRRRNCNETKKEYKEREMENG